MAATRELQALSRAYYTDQATLSAQAARKVERLWRRVKRGEIRASWLDTLPEVVATVTAAQGVSAELSAGYMATMAGVQDFGAPAAAVSAAAFAGATAEGGDLASLLTLPAFQALALIRGGASTTEALAGAGVNLLKYTASEVTNAGTGASDAERVTYPHVTGYYRVLKLPACARCAILAGKWFGWNEGFERHPFCDCEHVPVDEAHTRDPMLLDARQAILAGKVRGLSKKDIEAIELGADPTQVVNAKQGMRKVGRGKSRRQATYAGTTRRSLGGARMLAKAEARQRGDDVSQMTFTDYSFHRMRAEALTNAFRKGKTYTRVHPNGKVRTYAYQHVSGIRPTAAQIIADTAGNREEAIRLLTNYGYIV